MNSSSAESFLEPGYEKSSRGSRNIRFIITKDGENNGKHFVTDMPDSSQMVFSLGTFLFIETTDSRALKAATEAASQTARRR